MDLNTVAQFVSVVGFPVLACIYIYINNEKKDEQNRQERKEDKELWLKELETARSLYKDEIDSTRKCFSDKMEQLSINLGEIAMSMRDNNVRLDKVEDEVKDLKSIIVERGK